MGREEDRQQARAAREKEKELEVLRNQYLGVKKQKKKIIKPSEKFSKIFQFDWDASEDTSRDTNPLYSQRAQVRVTSALALAALRGADAGRASSAKKRWP